jgi:SagB-type dehydrogenase family enzyme
MLSYDDCLSLGMLFHLNSEPWMNADAYGDPRAHVRWRSFARGGDRGEGGATGSDDADLERGVGTEGGGGGDGPSRVALPRPDSSPLRTLIAHRASCRAFSGASIALPELGALLDAGYGVTALRRPAGEAGPAALARSVPSAGALYPLELFAVCDLVDGAAPGIYHYQPRDHLLERAAAAQVSIAELVPDLMHQIQIQSAAVLILFTAVLRQTMQKYGPRGYRYVLFEAGHAAQNICLRAAELKLATLCLGGFIDHRLNHRLALRGSHVALYAIAAGHPRP